MNTKFALAITLLLIILFAGCTSNLGEENTSAQDNQTPSIQNNTSTEQEEEEEEVIKSNLDKLKDYMLEHPVDEFAGLPDRMEDIDIDDNNASVEYQVSTHDPGQESWYIAGVVFLTFPQVEKTNIKGYNQQYKLIIASQKWPTRDDYDFPENWFGDVDVEAECTTDLECNDSDYCTKDKCYEGKCSNVWIVGCA